MTRAVVVAVALALAGCAGEFAYVPAVNANAQVSGQPAADYLIPPEAPQGNVRIASFGITPLEVNEEESVNALHLRLVVANNSPNLWMLDTRYQLATIGGEGQSRPIFAASDLGELPLVRVLPGQQRVVDLFYPLPADMQKASRLPAFDLSWRIDTGGGRVVSLRTPFERVEVEPTYASDGYYGPGWAPYWWYDPLYFDFTFAHPIIIRHPPVIIGRPFGSRHFIGHPPVRAARPPIRHAAMGRRPPPTGRHHR